MIECQVAELLSETELAINRGSVDGVKVGMEFRVVGSILVVDPERKRETERLEFTKVNVKVFRVGERMSIVRTTRTMDFDIDGVLFVQKMKFHQSDYDSITGEVSPAWSKVVKVGDKVVQVSVEGGDDWDE